MWQKFCLQFQGAVIGILMIVTMWTLSLVSCSGSSLPNAECVIDARNSGGIVSAVSRGAELKNHQPKRVLIVTNSKHKVCTVYIYSRMAGYDKTAVTAVILNEFEIKLAQSKQAPPRPSSNGIHFFALRD